MSLDIFIRYCTRVQKMFRNHCKTRVYSGKLVMVAKYCEIVGKIRDIDDFVLFFCDIYLTGVKNKNFYEDLKNEKFSLK